MAIIKGTRGHDILWGGPIEPAVIHGRGGHDEITGTIYDDTLFGDAGNDVLIGVAGNDRLFGGLGNDLLADGEGWNEMRGGQGNDLIIGTGLLVGGFGDDWIDLRGGIAYGDVTPEFTSRRKGNDTFEIDMRHAAPETTYGAVGGRGADHYQVTFSADGVASRLDVWDWSQREGDSININLLPGLDSGQFGVLAGSLEVLLDTNGDHVIDGRDPASPLGVTWADPNANAVCFLVNGDMVALWGTQSVAIGDWVL